MRAKTTNPGALAGATGAQGFSSGRHFKPAQMQPQARLFRRALVEAGRALVEALKAGDDSATCAAVGVWRSRLTDKERLQAAMLALAAVAPRDALDLLDALAERAGCPPIYFSDMVAEARHWAALATTGELAVYANVIADAQRQRRRAAQ